MIDTDLVPPLRRAVTLLLWASENPQDFDSRNRRHEDATALRDHADQIEGSHVLRAAIAATGRREK